MSNENSNNDKRRKPDYYVQLAQEGKNGREQITDVGAVWKSENGYITGNTIAGHVILQPREALEQLREMRQQTSQSPTQQHSQNHNQEH